MNDKELNRKFVEIDKRFDRIENAKPGEPVLGSELDKSLRRIEGNTADIKVDVGTVKERVDNHIRFFWGACALFFGLFLTAGGYIYSQQGRLSRLEAALPTAQLANAATGTLNEQKIQRIQRVVAEAKQTGARIEPGALSNAGRRLIQPGVKDDPKLASAAWQTMGEIVGYRSTLNAEFLPTLGTQGTLERTTHYSFPRTNGPHPEMRVFGNVPLSESAIIEPIGANLNRSLSMGDQYALLEGGELLIDGLQMKNVIFRGVKIIYHGGPVRMSNVYFVDCTFDLPQDDSGQKLALALLQEPATTFSAS